MADQLNSLSALQTSPMDTYRRQLLSQLESKNYKNPLDIYTFGVNPFGKQLNTINQSWDELRAADPKYTGYIQPELETDEVPAWMGTIGTRTPEDIAAARQRSIKDQLGDYAPDVISGNVNNLLQNWNTDRRNISPLTGQQYIDALEYVKNNPDSFIDMYGRVVSPGTKLWSPDKGGYFEYNPESIKQQRGLTQDLTFEDAGQYRMGITTDPENGSEDQRVRGSAWRWTPTVQGAKAPNPYHLMFQAGIAPDQDFGGTIGTGGWNAIRGVVGALAGGPTGGILGNLGAGIAATGLNAAMATRGAVDAANQGDTSGAILSGLGTVAGVGGASSLQGLANVGSGINSYVNTGNIGALGGTLSGLSSLYSDYNKMPETTNNLYDTSSPQGGDDMFDWMDSEFGGTGDEFGVSPGQLNTDLGDSGFINPAGGTGGDGGFLSAAGDLPWSKLIPAGVGLGLGIAGQVSNNSAANAQLRAQQAALAQQNAGTKSALDLQREMWEYQKKLNQPFYDQGLEGFRQYASAITGKPGPDGQVWSPTEIPGYQWQQEQLEKNLGRTLRSLGRANSSYGMNEMGNQKRSLAASEYDRQLNKLSDLTNIARGGASTLTSQSGSYGTNAGNLAVASGENKANAALSGGAIQQNNLYNNQNNLMSLANLGLKAYQGGMFG